MNRRTAEAFLIITAHDCVAVDARGVQRWPLKVAAPASAQLEHWLNDLSARQALDVCVTTAETLTYRVPAVEPAFRAAADVAAARAFIPKSAWTTHTTANGPELSLVIWPGDQARAWEAALSAAPKCRFLATATPPPERDDASLRAWLEDAVPGAELLAPAREWPERRALARERRHTAFAASVALIACLWAGLVYGNSLAWERAHAVEDAHLQNQRERLQQSGADATTVQLWRAEEREHALSSARWRQLEHRYAALRQHLAHLPDTWLTQLDIGDPPDAWTLRGTQLIVADGLDWHSGARALEAWTQQLGARPDVALVKLLAIDPATPPTLTFTLELLWAHD